MDPSGATATADGLRKRVSSPPGTPRRAEPHQDLSIGAELDDLVAKPPAPHLLRYLRRRVSVFGPARKVGHPDVAFIVHEHGVRLAQRSCAEPRHEVAVQIELEDHVVVGLEDTALLVGVVPGCAPAPGCQPDVVGVGVCVDPRRRAEVYRSVQAIRLPGLGPRDGAVRIVGIRLGLERPRIERGDRRDGGESCHDCQACRTRHGCLSPPWISNPRL